MDDPACAAAARTVCCTSSQDPALTSALNVVKSASTGQGLTLVPSSAQLELTLPLSAQLELTLSPIQPQPMLNRGCVLEVLMLSSNVSDVSRRS